VPAVRTNRVVYVDGVALDGSADRAGPASEPGSGVDDAVGS
jgi:hypothetical protein